MSQIAMLDRESQVLIRDRLERRLPKILQPILGERLGLRRIEFVYHPFLKPDAGFADMVDEAADTGVITDEQES